VLARLNGYDPERGVKIVGHRGYCLTGIVESNLCSSST
jgi:seryl-tRNA synthetase